MDLLMWTESFGSTAANRAPAETYSRGIYSGENDAHFWFGATSEFIADFSIVSLRGVKL